MTEERLGITCYVCLISKGEIVAKKIAHFSPIYGTNQLECFEGVEFKAGHDGFSVDAVGYSYDGENFFTEPKQSPIEAVPTQPVTILDPIIQTQLFSWES